MLESNKWLYQMMNKTFKTVTSRRPLISDEDLEQMFIAVGNSAHIPLVCPVGAPLYGETKSPTEYSTNLVQTLKRQRQGDAELGKPKRLESSLTQARFMEDNTDEEMYEELDQGFGLSSGCEGVWQAVRVWIISHGTPHRLQVFSKRLV